MKFSNFCFYSRAKTKKKNWHKREKPNFVLENKTEPINTLFRTPPETSTTGQTLGRLRQDLYRGHYHSTISCKSAKVKQRKFRFIARSEEKYWSTYNKFSCHALAGHAIPSPPTWAPLAPCPAQSHRHTDRPGFLRNQLDSGKNFGIL